MTDTTCLNCYGFTDATVSGYCRACNPSLFNVARHKPLLACAICATNVAITTAGLCATCYEPKPAPAPKARPRPSWDDYFFEMARLVSRRATCPRASIGCVIIRPEGHMVMGTGFNGALPGKPHCVDVGCEILADHCVTAIHAEDNAANQVAEHIDLASMGPYVGLVAYVVGPRNVCSHCAKVMHEVGVRDVKWRDS